MKGNTMKHTVVICGYGPAIGHATALKFGQAGHPVALVARQVQALADGVAALQAQGVQARAFPADLSDVAQVRRVIDAARSALGPIGVLHWNAFVDVDGDLLAISVEDLQLGLSLRVVSYIAAVQAAIHDLEATQGAVLSTNGVTAFHGEKVNAFAQDFGILAIPAAAQHKATGLLKQTLARRGVYVGEVVINGFVQGSVSTELHAIPATIAPADIAEQFWQLHAARTAHSVVFGSALVQ